MNDPKLFSEANSLQLQHSQQYLEDVKDLLKWEENENILDVGCADGKVTSKILFPFLPKNVHRLIGVDISEAMIDYAKKHSNHLKIRYETMNIAGKIPEEFNKKFQHIFSFYCLMMVEDQRKTFQNLYNMLKPEGQIMFSMVLKSPILAGVFHISKNPKWSPYMDTIHEKTYPYQFIDKHDEMLQNLLIAQEFNIQYYKLQIKSYQYQTPVFEKFALSVFPFINRIPNDKFEDFNRDFQEVVKRCDGVQTVNGTTIFKILVATVLISK